MRDESGRARAALLVDQEGPVLNMADRAGKIGLEVALGKDVGSFLLHDEPEFRYPTNAPRAIVLPADFRQPDRNIK